MVREPQSPDENELPKGAHSLILVVDDEAPVRESTRISLESYEYQVLTAKNGREAIDLYAKHWQEISLVLLDLMMPLMDGPATLRVLKRINPDVEVVAMSGLSSKGMVAAAAGEGIQRFCLSHLRLRNC